MRILTWLQEGKLMRRCSKVAQQSGLSIVEYFILNPAVLIIGKGFVVNQSEQAEELSGLSGTESRHGFSIGGWFPRRIWHPLACDDSGTTDLVNAGAASQSNA